MQRARTVSREFDREVAHVGDGLSRADPREQWSQRGSATGSDRLLVHGGRVVAAGHAGHRASRRVGLGRRFEQLALQFLVALAHLVKRAPRPVFRRHRVGVEPAAVDEAEEVLRGGGSRVEERGVDRARGVAHSWAPDHRGTGTSQRLPIRGRIGRDRWGGPPGMAGYADVGTRRGPACAGPRRIDRLACAARRRCSVQRRTAPAPAESRWQARRRPAPGERARTAPLRSSSGR